MKVLACPAARRRLHAFHDEELPISDQIAVSAHLDWCDECAASFAELRRLRAAIRASLSGRLVLSNEEDASLQGAIVNRAGAEHAVSFSAWLQEASEDMHLVYAGLGAAMAALLCVVVTLGLMRFATIERPDSFAAIVNRLESPGSNQNPISVNVAERMPRALDGAFSTTPGVEDGDAVFALAAVVTREGRIENLKLLDPGHSAVPGTDEAKAVEDLLGAVSRARFEPASMAGLPVAVNMVWIVAHTTVRATKGPLDVLPAMPAAKKRTASLTLKPSAALLRRA